jgi:uncharacterized protein (DUF1800 family)
MAVDAAPSGQQAQTMLALHRFGFGPRPGGIAAISSDPRNAVLAELQPAAGQINNPGLLDSGAAAREAYAFAQERKSARLAQPVGDGNGEKRVLNVPDPGRDMSKPADMAARPNAMKPGVTPAQPPNSGPGIPQQIFLVEAEARYNAALTSNIGLVERLVWFWSNHFCVSADKGPVRSLCGAYEREAIRPHVLGKFSNMLFAVETHPAMLLYLDNARSMGPSSVAGIRRGKGLNENLAREILELHTLGVRTIYSQNDVTNFAKILTGWTVTPPLQDPNHAGEFQFNPRMHEPGAQTVIGKSYSDSGFAQGRAVLENIGRHPATAKHIATKLVRHFVSDAPPSALVDRLSKKFIDTDGDLMEVAKDLVTAPESWQSPRNKLKRPGEWVMAAMRTVGLGIKDVRRVVNAQNLLGEPLWRPPAPKGFSDDSATWFDGLAQRLDIANQIARSVGNSGQEPDQMVDAALGSLASTETREAIKRAESRPQALALLLMAPEFQRR